MASGGQGCILLWVFIAQDHCCFLINTTTGMNNESSMKPAGPQQAQSAGQDEPRPQL